jgi:hypothetical protein
MTHATLAPAVVKDKQTWPESVLAQLLFSQLHAPTLAHVQFSEQPLKWTLICDGYD